MSAPTGSPQLPAAMALSAPVAALSTPVAARPEEGAHDERSLAVAAMGGRLEVRVAHHPGDADRAARDLSRVVGRVERWAARLTRFSDGSDLTALNADPLCPVAPVRPTLAGALDWSERLGDLGGGLVDVTMLDARLAAEDPESGAMDGRDTRPRRWWLERRPRGGIVHRRGTFRFDLDGVAKGWIADRAMWLLRDHPSALVDADGDIALRISGRTRWWIGVADPRPGATEDLLQLRCDAAGGGRSLGIATSGTSVHRWEPRHGSRARHHLIDPRTGTPARTDVVQATVIARNARSAEVLAKASLIAGPDAGMDLLERAGALGAVMLLASGEVIALPRTLEWMA